MAQGDARAVDVEALFEFVERATPALEHRQCLRRKGFVQLDQVHAVHREAGALEQLGNGGHGADAHARGFAPRHRPTREEGQRLQAERGQAVFGHHQAGRGGIVLLRGIAGRHDAVLHDGLELAQGLQIGVGAHAFVAVHGDGFALAARHHHGHHFVGELAGGPGRTRAALAAHRKGVGLLARDAEIARQVLGGFDHAADVAEALLGLRAHPAPLEPVVQGDRTGTLAPAHIGRVVLDVAHALDAAGHHDVGHTGLHHHRGRGHRLHTTAAATIDLQARHLDRQAGGHRHPAARARRLAVGIAVREDHVVDEGGIDLRALHEFARDNGAQLADRHGAQGAPVSADRGAQGTDDGGSPHGVGLSGRGVQIGSQANTSPERSRSKKLALSAGSAWVATLWGVQPSLRCTERTGRGWLMRKISLLRTAKI